MWGWECVSALRKAPCPNAYRDAFLALVWARAGLLQEEISSFVEAFSRGVAKLRMEINARLAPWRALPLPLCGLLAAAEGEALKIAEEALAMYEDDVANGRSIHPRHLAHL